MKKIPLYSSLILLLFMFSLSHTDICSASENFVKILELYPDPSVPLKAGSDARIKVMVGYSNSEDSAILNLMIQKDEFSVGMYDLVGTATQPITKGTGNVTLEKTVIVPDTSVFRVYTLLIIPGQNGSPLADFKVYQVTRNDKAEDPSQAVERAKKHNAALNKCLEYGSPSPYRIASLLARRDFKGLDNWFGEMLHQYKQDAQYECYLDEGYATFNQRYISLQDLDAWVAATGSPVAHTARGAYKAKIASTMKWGRNIGNMTSDKITEMKRYYSEAVQDLQIAVNKNPALIPAYTWLIKVAKASQMSSSARQMFQKAEENDKQSYSMRYEYMELMRPEWGGSPGEMTEFAEQMIPLADVNPRLWSLQGEVDELRAFYANFDKNYGSAVEFYTAALKFGDKPERFRSRSNAYSMLGQKELSKADLENFRYYASRNTRDFVPNMPTDIEGLNYEVSEKSYVVPQTSKNKVRSYFVMPIEQLDPWPDDQADLGQRDAVSNANKIEIMIMRLGGECVENVRPRTILDGKNISQQKIKYENAQTMGKLMSADAVIYTSKSHHVNYNTRMYSEDINIKAVSASTGKILWKSLLKGSAEIDRSTPLLPQEMVYDALDTKIYELLEQKLRKETNR